MPEDSLVELLVELSAETDELPKLTKFGRRNQYTIDLMVYWLGG